MLLLLVLFQILVYILLFNDRELADGDQSMATPSAAAINAVPASRPGFECIRGTWRAGR
jgi:hypothetical protein